MAISWKRIQQHLEAEARGEEERPVVSRDSLFGIPSATAQGIGKLSAQLGSSSKARQDAALNEAWTGAKPGVSSSAPSNVEPSAVPAWGPSHMSEEQAAAIKLKSDQMAQVADDLFGRFIDVLAAERGRSNLRQVARFMAAYLGERAIVGDADQYIFHVARANGYDIPAYPLSQSGEVRKFLADEGVADIRQWYARIGITGRDYETLSMRNCVAVLDARYTWHPFLITGAHCVYGAKFVPLAGSELVEHGDAALLVEAMEGIISYLG